MVEYAAYFHSKLVSNSLTGLPLPSAAVAQNIGLLGHSVGAGLATYVAQQAAAQQQPYKSVMYMAPQTQASAACSEPCSKRYLRLVKQGAVRAVVIEAMAARSMAQLACQHNTLHCCLQLMLRNACISSRGSRCSRPSSSM
jgi:alpha-beta hydrolase superfamily lysophospholipase